MWTQFAGGLVFAGAGLMAYGVRGRSSRLFGPSVWRGNAARMSLALTFDDGPSESTPRLLEVLARSAVPATFFQCGMHVRRLPAVAREVAAAGYEIGNHSDSHRPLLFRSASDIYDDLARAQQTISGTCNRAPALFRPPLGARWFGLRAAQERLGLLGVMWTAIGRDWRLPPGAICARLVAAARNGAIFCLHDGRGGSTRPDIRATVEAVSRLVPQLQDLGYQFETVSEILCPKN